MFGVALLNREGDSKVPENSRVVEESFASEALAATMHLYSIPRHLAGEVDALVVFPGLGEDWRIVEAIRVWNKWVQEGRAGDKYFLLAGQNQNEKTWKRPDLARLEGFGMLHAGRSNVRIQEHADNTVGQVNFIVGRLDEEEIRSLALFVSPYHLLRAYLTLLRGVQKWLGASDRSSGDTHPPVVMIPVPTVTPPYVVSPEVGRRCWDLVAGEYRRIQVYQEKGDVALFSELRAYLTLLWRFVFLPPSVKGFASVE